MTYNTIKASMMCSMDKFKISASFRILEECTNLLCEELSRSDIISATYFKLPDSNKQFEDEAPTEIIVDKITGDEAITSCTSAYRDFYLKDGRSGKVIQRHPGLILVNDESKALEQRLKQVNQAKLEFKNQILAIKGNDARFEAVHSAVPNLITLAAYRFIHFEAKEPSSVRFTWMQKHSTKNLSKEQALQLLTRSSSYSNPRMIDQASWVSLVENEKFRVASLSNSDKLRIRRPTRVTPEVNVRFADKTRYHVSGALPFIILNPIEKLKLGELSNYQSDTKDPRKREYNYLVERIYLEKS